jgi:dephospho-CoA kinase
MGSPFVVRGPFAKKRVNHGVYLSAMLRIGLTGGIGSGKSTVAKIFEVLGIPVYYADAASRRLMNEEPELVKEIIRHFGDKSYIEGKLNRPYIASIVFNNAEKLALLNAISHPATIEDANKWMQQQTTPYIIKEAALIFESGSAEHLDAVIGVYAPAPLRIKRTMDRDQVTQEEVKKRMERQINEELKMKLCDHIIVNDEQQLVVPQVMALHKKFLTLT